MVPASILHILIQTQGAALASRELARVDAAGKSAGANLSKAEKSARRTGGTFKALGSAAKYSAGLAGVAGLGAAMKLVGDEYREAQKTGAQTTAVIKSTGGAAQVTRKHIEDLANSISKKSGIDDEAIQSGQNLLLTFTNIRNEAGRGNKIFDQATQVITDMSVALGQDMKASAIQVGKALQDPVKGVTTLRRVGVQLSQQQQDQVKAFVASGDKMSAQKVILRELTREFGGSAAAQATAGDKLRVAIGNLAESAGRILVPALDKAATFVTKLIDAFLEGRGLAGQIEGVFKSIGKLVGALDPKALQVAAAAIGAVTAAVIALNIALRANPIILFATALAVVGVALVTAYQKFEGFRNVVNAVFSALKAAAPTVLAVASTIGSALVSAFGATVNAVRTAVGAVTSAFNAAVGAVRTAVQATITEVSKWKVAFAVIGAVVDVVKAAFGPLAAIARVYIGAMVTVAQGIMAQVINVFRTAWGVIKAVFSGAFTAISGITRGFGQALHGVIMIIGGILKGDFGQIWDGVKTIFRGAGTALTGIVKGWRQAIVGAVAAIGEGIWNSFKSAFQSAKSLVIGFVQDIVNVINKLPFVNIHVNLGGGGGGPAPGTPNLAGNTGRLARGGGYARTGGTGIINKPIVLMGEEAPTHPEFVIPTNPAYRKRAQGLAIAAGQAVGLAKGGILDKVTGAAGAVVGGVGKFLGQLPRNPLKPPLEGLGSYVLAKAGAFIKDKAKSALDAVTGGGGGVKPTGGKIQLPTTFAGTHHTMGFPGAALDAIDVMAPPGTVALSPAPGKITRFSGKPPSAGAYLGPGGPFGWSMYLQSGGNQYYMTHFGSRLVKVGQEVGYGDPLGLVGDYPGSVPDHIHESRMAQGGIFGRAAGKVRALAAGGLTGNPATAARFLRSHGLTPAQIAGIIGVMQGESGPGLSTTATNPNSGAYGIAQWLGSRKAALMARRNPSSLTTQLAHLWSELQGPESKALSAIRGAHTIDEAVKAWLFQFERPGPGEANLPGRTANARRVFAGLSKAPGASRGGGSSGGGSTTGAGGGGPSVLESKQAAIALRAAELQARVGGDITIPDTFVRPGGAYDTKLASQAAGILKQQQQAIGARIKQLRKALATKGHSRAARVKYQQELATLLPQHADLGRQRAALIRGPSPNVDTSGGDFGGDSGDPNQPLIDALNAAAEAARIEAEAVQAHTDALTANSAQIKAQTDFANAVSTTEAYQLKKMLAEFAASGMGALVAQRSTTPGTGPVAQY